ncbi:hypothetical protein [Kribbella sp. NPDC048915]|uniref:hypothetical protein n=1 Tax=Kribbella sp. NPDC048915 TaxID=3155148 RepID=UPI0033C3ECD7
MADSDEVRRNAVATRRPTVFGDNPSASAISPYQDRSASTGRPLESSWVGRGDSRCSARRCRTNDAVALALIASPQPISRSAARINSISAIGDITSGRVISNADASAPPGGSDTQAGASRRNISRSAASCSTPSHSCHSNSSTRE